MRTEALARRATVASRVLAGVTDALSDTGGTLRDVHAIRVPLPLPDVLEILGAYLGSDHPLDPPEPTSESVDADPPPDRVQDRRKVEPLLGTRFARDRDTEIE